MDDIIKTLLTGFPTFAGLVLFIYFLWKQNDKLLSVLIDEVRGLRVEIASLKEAIKNFKFPEK